MVDKKLLLIGGGGHCKSIIDTLSTMDEYSEIAIIDKKELVGTHILGIPIIGTDDDLCKLFNQGFRYAFISVGSLGDTNLRRKLYNHISTFDFIVPNIIDKSAIVSQFANLTQGIFIGKSAVVNAGATLHPCAIINTNAIIEHDCNIHTFAHIAPGAVLSGEVQIGKHTHIGSNSVIRQGLCIGSNNIIGIGSVVTKPIDDNIIAFGNPCRVVKIKP